MFTLQADRVLAAVGQEADLEFLPASWKERIAASGLAAVDHATAMTSLAGVFAAGDVVSGPSTVIEAIAAGHSAAESIRHYLEEGRPGIRDSVPSRAPRRSTVFPPRRRCTR